MENTPISVVLGMDMETDVGSFGSTYDGLLEGTPKLLELFEAKHIEATFFFTGISARMHPQVVRQVQEAGHEVGCHSLYHETIGDELFPIPGERPLLPEEVPLRIERATQWVGEAAGEAPVSFRCPRLWGSTAVVQTLENLGYIADASYPMYYYRGQFVPYYPSADDWTKQGDMSILEIPNFADMTMASQDPPLERDRDQWPIFRTEGASALLEKIRSFQLFVEKKGLDPVICLYLHPWEFVPCPISFHYGEAEVFPDPFITKNCGDPALKQLGAVIDGLLAQGARFYRADTFAREMKQKTGRI